MQILLEGSWCGVDSYYRLTRAVVGGERGNERRYKKESRKEI